MELRHLRYVLILSQEQNFSRAAVRLHIAQPTLSQEIRKLERELRLELFARTPRGVQLTEAGRALLPDMVRVLALTDRLLATAQARVRAESGQLRVGFVAATAPPVVARIVNRFSAEHPGIEVELAEAALDTPSAGLADGSVDVALIWPPIALSGIAIRVLLSQPRVAVLPAGHRLAARTSITIDELEEDPIVTIDSPDETWSDFWIAGPERSRPPALGPASRSMDGLLALVAAGSGVGLAPVGLADELRHPDLAFVPVADIPPATLAVAWSQESRHQAVQAFVSTAIQVSRDILLGDISATTGDTG